jgi:hypothetical protein
VGVIGGPCGTDGGVTDHGLILGHLRDSTVVHVRAVAERMAARVCFVDIGAYVTDGSFTQTAAAGAILAVGGREWHLDDFPCIYQRVYLGFHARPPAVSRLVALETALYSSRSRVINRPFGGWQNMSKPFQTLMLLERFMTPASRSTSIPDDYRRFRERTGDIIYKSNSGERSIVDHVSAEHDERADRLVECPALFQQQIVGDDVRVHVFQDEAFAVRVRSDAVDYRYYKTRGSFADLEPEPALPPEIGKACVEFAAASGVVLAGFDFKVDAEGRWYCLEMNPSPAFESYDHVLDGIIARRLVESLTGAQPA